MKLKKIMYYLYKILIKAYAIINQDISNKYFIKYLKKIGINMDGSPLFISQDVYLDGTDYSLISIGDKSVISREVTVLTHDFAISRAMEVIEDDVQGEYKILKEVIIGKNSFIGAKSILLPGTVIGDNTIIGAGSVVTGKIPDNVVAAGNPCRVIQTIDKYYERQLKNNKEYIFFNG